MATYIIQADIQKTVQSGKEFSHKFYVISRFMQIILCIKCENIYKTVYKEIQNTITLHKSHVFYILEALYYKGLRGVYMLYTLRIV